MVPIIFMVMTSIKPVAEIYRIPATLLPERVTLDNYIYVLTGEYSGAEHPRTTLFPRYFLNSIVIGIASTGIAITIAIFAAYGFARFRFRGSSVMLFMVMIGMMVPAVGTVIPFFILSGYLHILNTYAALILPYSAYTLPVAIWVLTDFFKAIPPEIEEAALLDGCSRMKSLFAVLLPLVRPGVAVTAALSFATAWQEFMFAVSLTSSDSMRTVPVGISMFMHFNVTDYGFLMAASTLAALPAIVIFLLLEKYIVAGLMRGGIKG
jgi:ABC-type glycerol-3-phosphate transport system permease component